MFKDHVVLALMDAAKGAGLEPAALLALAEVETSGATFEADGRTPTLLYERHVAWREAKKRSQTLLAAFKRAGLAIPKWSKATQYQDQRSSSQRLNLIARARAIDCETAERSASWGIGQIMGFLAEDLGFASARAMVAHMTGSLAGQIDCMLREIRHQHLIEPLNAHDWKHVARIYNGKGYAANQYDTRLANAYARWTRKLARIVPDGAPRAAPPEQALSKDEVLAVQKRLRELGYAEAGTPDGHWGTRTTGALAAFQAHEGLPQSGHYDDETRAALNAALPRPVASAREMASAEDLKADGSTTIAQADNVSLLGKAKMAAGGLLLGGGGASQLEDKLDTAQEVIDKASQVKSTWDSLHDLAAPLFAHPMVLVCGVALLAGGFLAWRIARAIKARRVADHQSGVHAGVF